MKEIIIGLLWGLGGSLIVVPVVIWFYHLIKKTIERRKIKRMINNGEFLTPIDKKDFDSKTWEKEINMENSKQEIEKLNDMFVDKEAKENV